MAPGWPTPDLGDRWTPTSGVRAAERALGRTALVDWCVELLTGRVAGADPSTPSLRWIGGAAAGTDAHRDYWARPEMAYWPRVWAARALRYVWQPSCASAVVAGLDDAAWRVREHCCALAGAHEIADAADRLAALGSDIEQTPRVRAAAVKALAAVGEYEHAAAIKVALDDPEPAVREAAERALRLLADRLDRPLD